MANCQSRQCNPGGKEAQTELPEDENKLHHQLGQINHKILVMSGKGGVGKSSVSTYLSLGLARRGYRVGLLDTDFHGPDTLRMLGLKDRFQTDKEERLVPQKYNDKLGVVSIEGLLPDRDTAIIWRGPMKHGAIKQFIAEVNWGHLDFLVIDSPPGTGDEPLSVAQTITGAQALVVTTPQEISLADVRKAIDFCRKVEMPILGLVENMSGLVCPHCGTEVPLFSRGGGQKTATLMEVPLLATLPFDLRVVEGADLGQPLLETADDSPFLQTLEHLVDEVEHRLTSNPLNQAEPSAETLSSEVIMSERNTIKIAIPLADGRLCNHFGHCEKFAVIQVKEGSITGTELRTPPPHEPGVLPGWLRDLGVNLIIAGGMGQRALNLFEQNGIHVIIGSPNEEPETLVKSYLAGTLVSGPNVCDH